VVAYYRLYQLSCIRNGFVNTNLSLEPSLMFAVEKHQIRTLLTLEKIISNILNAVAPMDLLKPRHIRLASWPECYVT
jgi:hypothetical protein